MTYEISLRKKRSRCFSKKKKKKNNELLPQGNGKL